MGLQEPSRSQPWPLCSCGLSLGQAQLGSSLWMLAPCIAEPMH